MATITVEEVETKINELSDADRTKLLLRLNQSQRKNGEAKEPSTNGKKGYVHPNTVWMRDHSRPYGGRYVALENGKLVATGKGYPDTLAHALKAGAVKPMIGYIPREDEELFAGGW